MRFFLNPENNALSGVAGCLALHAPLPARRNQALVEDAPQPHSVYLGPLLWNGWAHDQVGVHTFADQKVPLAVVTCSTSAGDRIVQILLELGFRVVVAAGGDPVTARDPRVTVCSFAPLQSLLPLASLVVCHGGEMTIFEALLHQVPVLVLPFQSEPPHNPLGARPGQPRLGWPQAFRGNPALYVDAFFAMSDEEVRKTILQLLGDPATATALDDASEAAVRYRGVAAKTAHLEEN